MMRKPLPQKVADAFATIAVTGVPPSTYPSRNPRFIYFLRPGHRASELMRDEAWDKYPFDEFEPYIEKTGETSSVAICYRLRKEYEP
jgi:hypothetical protein